MIYLFLRREYETTWRDRPDVRCRVHCLPYTWTVTHKLNAASPARNVYIYSKGLTFVSSRCVSNLNHDVLLTKEGHLGELIRYLFSVGGESRGHSKIWISGRDCGCAVVGQFLPSHTERPSTSHPYRRRLFRTQRH